jgi:hypothetical protein
VIFFICSLCFICSLVNDTGDFALDGNGLIGKLTGDFNFCGIETLVGTLVPNPILVVANFS